MLVFLYFCDCCIFCSLGDVLTRCMVEGALSPIGGLRPERSHWSRLLVAAVWQERQLWSGPATDRKEKEEVGEVAGEVEVLNFTSCSLRCLSEGGGVGANTLTSG